MNKNIKDNLRTLFSIIFIVLVIYYLNPEKNYLSWGTGILLGAISLVVFDIYFLKIDKISDSILKEKIWDFFLYMPLIIMASSFPVIYIESNPNSFYFGVFSGFALFSVFKYKANNALGLLYRKIWERIIPGKNQTGT